ncbi:MAG: hypothetical protein RLZZ292_2944 [Bacteroidota bacterium]|jgi:Uma2 family endonuclease
MTITSFSQLDPTKQYTYADYLTWQFEDRLEIIKGWVMRMASPSRAHQFVLGEISFGLRLHFRNHPCEVYFAPTDVRFLDKEKTSKKNKDIYTVLIPDLFVICDLKKMQDGGCLGAPDLVVEILSPGNTKKEMKYKYEIYEENGVKEYWVVHPIDKNIVIHALQENGKYQASKYFTDEDILVSVLFPDFSMDLSTVFLNKKE